MNRIFLNDPKKPKGPGFYLVLILLVALVSSQVVLVTMLFKQRNEQARLARLTTVPPPAPTVAVTEPSNPIPLSVRDEEKQQVLDDYFGPLPDRVANPPKHQSLYPVKGIYLGRGNNLDSALELAKWSEVNAFVIDVKESWGLTYASEVPLAQEVGAAREDFDLQAVIDQCKAAGVKVIARIVCFKDEVLPKERPDLCITDEEGNLLLFPLEGNQAFANPYDTRVWDYLVDIAKEVIAMGADEIQFDYVRFPTGNANSDKPPVYALVEEDIPKEYAINRFLEYARIEIQENLGIPVTADLFSIVMTSEIDGQLIGQNWSTIGLTGIDAICPMIYPSHYANASMGSQGNGVGSYIGRAFFEKPDLEPYAVIENAMIDGEKSSLQTGYAQLRPWLQAFTANWLVPGFYMEYGGVEIRSQIQALYDSGYYEWILWNAEYTYPDSAFISKEEAETQEKQQVIESLAQASEVASEAAEQEKEDSRRFPIATPAPAEP